MRPNGRARVSTRYPQAFAICDRCGSQYNLVDLNWEFQFAGQNLVNSNLLVCDRCLDIPNPQLSVPTISPDPPPVLDARPRKE